MDRRSTDIDEQGEIDRAAAPAPSAPALPRPAAPPVDGARLALERARQRMLAKARAPARPAKTGEDDA